MIPVKGKREGKEREPLLRSLRRLGGDLALDEKHWQKMFRFKKVGSRKKTKRTEQMEGPLKTEAPRLRIKFIIKKRRGGGRKKTLASFLPKWGRAVSGHIHSGSYEKKEN